jgi:biotin carboxyl carrier protein
MIYEVVIDQKSYQVELARTGSGWRCRLNGREFPADVVFSRSGVLSILVDGKSYEVKQETTGTETSIVVGHEHFAATVRDPRSLRSRRRVGGAGEGIKKVSAPMPGKVVRILTPAGTDVEAGQPLLVIEAMKMQNELKAPRKGKVKRIAVSEGAAVEAGEVLAEIE